MSISKLLKLKKDYDRLKKGKQSLLTLIDEAEIPESVYNSNAIENSTLSLKETEQILMEMEIPRKISLREVFEAKNLARVSDYVRKITKIRKIDRDLILFLHKMLISSINDDIAGRFRLKNEYVRVGTHIAPAPEHLERLIDQALVDYEENLNSHFLQKIAKFHLDFETIHPFNDGNGRIGRALINYQLQELGFPPIIIRDKDKKQYYQCFQDFRDDKIIATMEKVLLLSLCESLHKRLAYLQGKTIIDLVEFARKSQKSPQSLLNAAKRQTIPAFREKGIWKIA